MKWVIRIAAGIAGVLILAVLVLLAMGQRSGAGKAHASIEIKTTPDRLWRWLDENEKLKQWISWTVEVRSEGAAASGVGARRKMVMKDENNGGMLMEIQSTCTEYNPPIRMTVETSSPGAFQGRQAYRLTDLGNGSTRLEVDSEYRFSIWFARLMEPLVTPAVKDKMARDLAHLKSLVESGAAAEALR